MNPVFSINYMRELSKKNRYFDIQECNSFLFK